MFFLFLRYFFFLSFFFHGQLFGSEENERNVFLDSVLQAIFDGPKAQLEIKNSLGFLEKRKTLLENIFGKISLANNYYEALDLPFDAAAEEATKSYRKLFFVLIVFPVTFFGDSLEKERCVNAFKKLELLRKEQGVNEPEAIVFSYFGLVFDVVSIYRPKLWSLKQTRNIEKCSKILSEIDDFFQDLLEKHLGISRSVGCSERTKLLDDKIFELQKARSILQSELQQKEQKGREDKDLSKKYLSEILGLCDTVYKILFEEIKINHPQRKKEVRMALFRQRFIKISCGVILMASMIPMICIIFADGKK